MFLRECSMSGKVDSGTSAVMDWGSEEHETVPLGESELPKPQLHMRT